MYGGLALVVLIFFTKKGGFGRGRAAAVSLGCSGSDSRRSRTCCGDRAGGAAAGPARSGGSFGFSLFQRRWREKGDPEGLRRVRGGSERWFARGPQEHSGYPPPAPGSGKGRGESRLKPYEPG